jgi:hypothetical protein
LLPPISSFHGDIAVGHPSHLVAGRHDELEQGLKLAGNDHDGQRAQQAETENA